ncbi:putative disease resistance RPP13-like protein 1 [Pistacia vera]|uniref:putative disease resistance RPP13-like protein 1 n=1 Tax=Pistacia vera TaxID=55513 RepID=UPI001262D525|nr:putative disease resistance RPP13-like protein 1 [Pistacia vera]
MAELISAILPLLFEKLSSPELFNYFASVKGVRSKLKKWERKLLKIEAVLSSAEEKQLTNKAVKLWLDDLQDLAYDVEDLLEEFSYEVSRQNSIDTPSCFNNFTPRAMKFDVSMRSKMKDINGRFEELHKERVELGLMHETSGGTSSTAASTQQAVDPRPPTSSLPTEEAVYGRGEDKKEIIKMVSSDKPIDANFGVIAIVGMGGLGKTTLAREVYNDKELDHLKFEEKAWVSVSDDFDVMRISKSVLESIIRPPPNLNSLNEVQDELKKQIRGRKFLLVLDDVWNETESLWETFKSPFKDSARGSKIIVTTRNERVAVTMRSSETHKLKTLSDDECWNLFMKHAPSTGMDSNALGKFRERVVKKCGGLPLAAKTLGGLLHYEPKVDAWENILNSRVWDSSNGNDILPVLRLSYRHLPPHLKRCFAYCAIFPKDYEFDKKELELLWMGEGIIQQSDEHLNLAGEYFLHLCSRSLFEQSSSNSSKYVMHDLVHDLAQSIFGEIGYRFEEVNSMVPKKFERTRHFSYISKRYDGKSTFKDLQKLKSLRTFFPVFMSPYWRYGHSYIDATVIFNLLPHLKKLRVLSLERYHITCLPNSIGGLIHLKYLNLSNTMVKSLPESTSSLLNLQTLLLKDCSRLLKLPSKMRHLTNLCHLDIKGAKSLKGMPSGMKELINLRMLSNFIVVKGKNFNLNDLRNLKFLQRELHISKLENLSHQNQIREPVLKNMKDLEILLLEWGSQSDGSPNEEVERHVLEMLKPHSNLKELVIKCYGGACFPSWLGDSSSLSNMTILKLENCNNSGSLPSIWMLSSLKDLAIQGMGKLEKIDFEMPFKSLEVLHLQNLQEWRYWNNKKKNEDVEKFPLLRKLSIIKCPKLAGELPNSLPSLERLFIQKCSELKASISSVPSLCKIEINDCKEVVCRSTISTEFQSLNPMALSSTPKFGNWIKQGFQKISKIVCCEELTNSWQNLSCVGKPLHGIHSLTSLKELSFVNCTSLVLFPEIDFLPNLSSLTISNWEALKSLHEGLKQKNLERLVIKDCDSLTVFERGILTLYLKKIKIQNCKQLEHLEDLSTTRLEYLDIHDCPSLTCISSNGCLPDTLKRLWIERCQELTTLSSRQQCFPKALERLLIDSCSKLESIIETFENSTCLKMIMFSLCDQLKSVSSDLQNLTCLEMIMIWDCPNMEISFKFPNSLQFLSVGNCPILFAEEGVPINLTELLVQRGSKICKSLIEGGLHNLTSLRELRITGCDDSGPISQESMGTTSSLTSLSTLGLQSLTSLKWLAINNFRELKTIQDLSCLISLESLEINGCPNLESIPDLGSLASLNSLKIKNCENLESILELGSLTSLESLSIDECPKLKSIPDLGSLTSLESLCIQKCPKLKSLQSMPPSLLDLRIDHCPLLKRRWKRGRGKYCSKIAHVPKVHMDGNLIFNSKEEE